MTKRMKIVISAGLLLAGVATYAAVKVLVPDPTPLRCCSSTDLKECWDVSGAGKCRWPDVLAP